MAININDITWDELKTDIGTDTLYFNVESINIDDYKDNPQFLFDVKKYFRIDESQAEANIDTVEWASAKANTITSIPSKDNWKDERFCAYFGFNTFEGALYDNVNDYIDFCLTAPGTVFSPNICDIWIVFAYYNKSGNLVEYSPAINSKEMFNKGRVWFNDFPTDVTGKLIDNGGHLLHSAFLYNYQFALNFATNIPLFANRTQALHYLTTGDSSNAMQKVTPQEEDTFDSSWYFYNMQEYKSKTDYESATLYKTVSLQFYMTKGGRVSGYTTESAPSNVEIDSRHSGQLIKGTLQIDDGEIVQLTSYEEMLNLLDNQLAYTEEGNAISDGSWYYFANVHTNIPIFTDENDSTRYQNHEIDSSVAKTGNKPILPNRTGTDLKKVDNTSIDISNEMSVVYIMQKEGLNTVANNLYSTDEDIITAMLNGLKMMGNNPIDVINSFYVTSIDVNQFLTNKHDEDVWIGGLKTNAVGIVGNNDVLMTLCNTYIAPTFNNFLDYSNMFLSLYLPACGIVPLDTATYLGKYLKIDCCMDIRTHTIKYYLKANDCLVEMHEGSIGADIPVTGADQIARTKQLQGAFADTVKGVGNIIGKNILGGANDIYNAISGINAEPSIKQSGATSSNVNCFDPLIIYLIIDIQNAIIPSNLYKEYGYPTNTIQSLSNCKGWTEAHDIKLKGSMTNKEKEMIKSLFERGVVI